MKSKHNDPNRLLRAIPIMCCVLIALGCSPRKPAAPIEKESGEVEIEVPAVETGPSEPESSDLNQEASPQPLAQASEESQVAPSPSNPTESVMPADPPQTWSVQRIIALSATGPILIDVSANIGGKSLEEAASAATGRAVARIGKDLEKPWTWPKLLDHPLIRSGWLGNLPEGDQREQLISKYNTDGDDEVDEDELPAFLTRGLSRGAAFQFTDIGSAPGTTASRSPWEQLDTNLDSSLDKSEIANIPNVVAKFDLNADRVLTATEMQANRTTRSSEMMGRSSMLETKSAIAVGAEQKPPQAARKLLEHYTSLGTVSRDQWPNWSDKQWSDFDKDGDMQITRQELEPITTVQPNLALKIRFQATAESGSSISASVCNDGDFTWSSRLKTSGQASGTSGAIAVVVSDSYTAANRASLRPQLAAALSNPQLAMVFRNQLQLGENAFDVLDADNDDKLSDEEFENAWDWITAIRGNRILARWMFAESAWFRMADVDADSRLTQIELQKFESFLNGLDRDKDGSISPIEIPVTIRLEIARTDDRIAINFPTGTEMGTVEVGWFAASDSNNDGFVNNSEFLGSNEDFQAYDADNDGFISATEAFNCPPARLQ